MKYTKPLNETNEDAGYVNADVTVGRRGSTVPASAIEHPQREIVAVIVAAGLTPDGDNHTQLDQAITAKIAEGTTGKADKSEAVLSATVRHLVVLANQAAYDALSDEQKADETTLYVIKG